MKNNYLQLLTNIVFIGLAFTLNGCVFSTFQTAKSMGQNNTALGGGILGGNVITKSKVDEFDRIWSGRQKYEYTTNKIVWPVFWLRYGASNKVDLILKGFNPSGVGGKWQFLGDQESKWAMALNGECLYSYVFDFGGGGAHADIVDLYISLIVSREYELIKNDTFLSPYFAPKVIFRRAEESNGNIIYSQNIGFNFGINLKYAYWKDKEIEWMLEYNFVKDISDPDFNSNSHQIGLGASYKKMRW